MCILGIYNDKKKKNLNNLWVDHLNFKINSNLVHWFLAWMSGCFVYTVTEYSLFMCIICQIFLPFSRCQHLGPFSFFSLTLMVFCFFSSFSCVFHELSAFNIIKTNFFFSPNYKNLFSCPIVYWHLSFLLFLWVLIHSTCSYW